MAEVKEHWLDRAAEYVTFRNEEVRRGADANSVRVNVIEERASHCVSRAKGK
jgi:hypothetical protein